MNTIQWNETNIPDQNGRTILVTGASSGIGYQAAKVLAAKGAQVIIAVRNMDKGKAAMQKISTGHPKANVKVMQLDLADLTSVRKFAAAFTAEFPQLDVLINNAGVMIPPYTLTKDGFELQFGTNHLGHFLLTALLFETIRDTPGSRIITVASLAHKYGNPDFSDLDWKERKYKAWTAYGDSKLANLLFNYELAERLKKAGIPVIAAAAHPGWTKTELQRNNKGIGFLNFLAQSIETGALPTLRAAIDAEVKPGAYYGPDGWGEMKGYPVLVQSNAKSHDKKLAQDMWAISEKLTQVKFL